MKKGTISLFVILILQSLFVSASAAGTFYCEYVPKTETGSLFYVDVYCERAVTSAVIELSYDQSAVEYRSVSSDAESSSRDANGKVSIALANRSAFSGKLCRVGFMALSAGETGFELHMAQACDGNLDYITGLADYSLKIKLGKDDVAASPSASSKTDGTEKSSSKSSSKKTEEAGGRSYIGSVEDTNDDPAPSGGVFDLRRNDSWSYILLGAGAVILLAAAAFAGFYIGRKIAKKKTADNGSNETASADALPQIGDDQPEDIVSHEAEDTDNDDSPINGGDTGYIPIPDVIDE